MWVLYLVLKAMLSNLKVSNSCFFILSLSVVETKRSSYTYTARNSQVAAGVLQLVTLATSKDALESCAPA